MSLRYLTSPSPSSLLIDPSGWIFKDNPVHQNLKSAVYYFQLSADQGNPSAQYGLGTNKQTPPFLLCLFQLPITLLGLMLQNGLGTPQPDLKQASRYFKRALKQGNEPSKLRLGLNPLFRSPPLCLIDFRHNVPKW